VPQIRPLADIVHYKYIFTYLLTYLHIILLCYSQTLLFMSQPSPVNYIEAIGGSCMHSRTSVLAQYYKLLKYNLENPGAIDVYPMKYKVPEAK